MSWNSGPVEVRLWRRVKRGKRSACWEWRGSWATNGYGRMRVGSKIMSVHRVAWEVTNGPVPDGLFVCHKCDNKLCCNPRHLFIGTAADNNADRDRKGRTRAPKGENHPHSKLTLAQVRVIKERIKAGESSALLAYQYAVTRNAINQIKWGKTYVEA